MSASVGTQTIFLAFEQGDVESGPVLMRAFSNQAAADAFAERMNDGLPEDSDERIFVDPFEVSDDAPQVAVEWSLTLHLPLLGLGTSSEANRFARSMQKHFEREQRTGTDLATMPDADLLARQARRKILFSDDTGGTTFPPPALLVTEPTPDVFVISGADKNAVVNEYRSRLTAALNAKRS